MKIDSETTYTITLSDQEALQLLTQLRYNLEILESYNYNSYPSLDTLEDVLCSELET